MRSGQLKAFVNIERPPTDDASDDDLGGRDTSAPWVVLYELVPAKVKQLVGFEIIRAQKVVEQATTEIQIRYHSGVDTTMRVTWDGRVFAIGNVNDVDNRHREMILLCIEER